MSERTNHLRLPIANRSWLLSESAQRSARLSTTPQARIDSVRENLEARYLIEREIIRKRRHRVRISIFGESLFVANPTDPTDGIRD